MKWLIDTDVLIDFLRGEPAAQKFLTEVDQVTVSAMTVAELHAGVREGLERQALDAMLDVVEVLPVDQSIASAGGLLRRDWGPSHGLGLVDAVIAATALEHGLRLASLNLKHFPMLSAKQIKQPYKKSLTKRR